jgi:hypothetical protein
VSEAGSYAQQKRIDGGNDDMQQPRSEIHTQGIACHIYLSVRLHTAGARTTASKAVALSLGVHVAAWRVAIWHAQKATVHFHRQRALEVAARK